MPDVILTTVKRTLGLAEDYDVFDEDVVMHINSVFGTLNQLGIGPEEGFYIESDGDEEWDEFIDDPRLAPVKSYMYLRVRMLFDPPTTSYLLNAYEKQILELEWRLRVQGEDPT